METGIWNQGVVMSSKMAESRVSPVRPKHKPLNVEKCRLGWRNQREYCYWIPEADIEGEIPRDLYGTLFRNGPGVDQVYGTKLKHPIDGDGMVCALTFQNGHVHFKSRFVSTKHRQEENEKRRFIYMGQMGTIATGPVHGTFALLGSLVKGKLPQVTFRNPSNTNSFYWGGKLLTCYETSIPYCLDPHTLETLGPDTLCGALKLKALAAHFRIDAKNQRLICISLRPGFRQSKPSLAIYEFTPSWKLHQSQLHHIPGLNYAHDFILLDDYYIFHITPFVKSTWLMILKILSGWSSPAEEMKYYSDLPSRFVIVPRKMDQNYREVIMVDTEPFHIYHFGTAQRDGDSITFTAVCFDTNFNMDFDHKIWLSNVSVSPGRLYKFHIDLSSKKCTRTLTDRASAEFPYTHPYRHGMIGTRFNYLMANDRPEENLPYRDIVKCDAKSGKRQVWYSHGVIGEPVFVPRLGYDSWKTGDEDDGYIIVQLYVPDHDVTEFCILDAKDLGKGPLARVKLKHRIPYGFHGTFTPEVFLTSPLTKSKL